MSRLWRSPWCFPLGCWLHFWQVWFSRFLQKLQGSESSIKNTALLPDCRKRSNATFFLPHRLDHLFEGRVLFGCLAGRFCSPRPAARLCPILDHRFPTICFLGLTVLSRASRSRLTLSTVSFALSPLFTLALPSPAR